MTEEGTVTAEMAPCTTIPARVKAQGTDTWIFALNKGAKMKCLE